MTIKLQRMSNYHANKLPVNSSFSPDDIASSGIPIVVVTVQETAQDEEEEDLSEILPLPASRYRYTKWHELEEMEVSSNMLRSPRVRKAPRGYRKDTVWLLDDLEQADSEDETRFADLRKRMKKRRKKHDYRNKLETWENCESANLSYQELGHNYQMKEFHRVLRRLIRCEHLQLMDDGIDDLSTILFPRCTHLYIQRNYLSTFKKLPKIPNIKHLSLQQNNITSLDGLELFTKTSLRSLVLEGNPISLQPGYRRKVFKILPDLKLLDGLPHLPSDVSDDDTLTKSGGCAIS